MYMEMTNNNLVLRPHSIMKQTSSFSHVAAIIYKGASSLVIISTQNEEMSLSITGHERKLECICVQNQLNYTLTLHFSTEQWTELRKSPGHTNMLIC